MDAIMGLAWGHELVVIEDSMQAHGARFGGQSVSSLGDVGACSFCQAEIMTMAGEGGMVTTNDEKLWSKIWSRKDHGQSYDAVFNREDPPDFRWLH